jgi:hypothetical protein
MWSIIYIHDQNQFNGFVTFLEQYRDTFSGYYTRVYVCFSCVLYIYISYLHFTRWIILASVVWSDPKDTFIGMARITMGWEGRTTDLIWSREYQVCVYIWWESFTTPLSLCVCLSNRKRERERDSQREAEKGYWETNIEFCCAKQSSSSSSSSSLSSSVFRVSHIFFQVNQT